MIRRPPRSTRTDTLFPYTTLFRSGRRIVVVVDGEAATRIDHMIQNGRLALVPGVSPAQRERQAVEHLVRAFGKGDRKSVRVGKECVSTGRSRWSPYH